MPFDPFTTATSDFADSHTSMVETLDDVVAWLERDAAHLRATTRRDYRNAVKRISKLLRRPLISIPAALPTLSSNFPRKNTRKLGENPLMPSNGGNKIFQQRFMGQPERFLTVRKDAVGRTIGLF